MGRDDFTSTSWVRRFFRALPPLPGWVLPALISINIALSGIILGILLCMGGESHGP